MKKYLEKTAEVVKTLKIKNVKQCNEANNYFKILELYTLKYLLQEKDVRMVFRKIIIKIYKKGITFGYNNK